MPKFTYTIRPSKCVEDYFVHTCERYLLYSGLAVKDRNSFKLDRPSGSGNPVAARAGDALEVKVITEYIDEKLLHVKKEIKDGKTSYHKFDPEETIDELKKMVSEVGKDKKTRYLYQGTLKVPEDLKRTLFRFDEDLYNGKDKDLKVDFSPTNPDLIRVHWDDEMEKPVLSVIDIKLARRMKLAHKVQVALYIEILQAVADEYKLDVPVNKEEGYLWNGGQTEERPFPVREVSELLDGYFSNILPEFIAKLYDSIKSGKTAGLKGILDNCVGQKCEWCENGRQCIKELKEGSRTQVIPYLSAYAQKYARKIRAPEGIKDFKKFVSDMDNRKLLSCNRSWDYIINDGVTVEVQSEAAPYKWEDIKNTDYKWKNVKSLTLPRWQDVMVVLTAQKYAGDNRVYALGIYTNEYKGQGEAPAEDNETGHSSNWETGSFIFISEENTEDAYRENVGSFVKKLHEVLEKYDTLNRQTGPGERKISLQGYVMDPYELMNLEEVLYETLETETDTGLIGEVMDILFWMQGEKLVETEGDKPHETEFPVIVIGRELRKLISLPLPVAYRLPDVMRAMKVWVEEDMLFTKEDHEDYFELISNVMKSDVIHRVWNEGKKDETEKIREHITKRLYSEGRILIKMQGEGRKNNSLVRSISGFYMPGRISYQNDLLRKWAFEVRLENLLAYHQIRGGRLKELDIAKAEGTIIEMEVTGLGDVGTAYGRPCRQIKLHTDSLTADFTGGWFSAAIVKTDHLMDLYRFNDHKYSDNKVFLDDLGILGGIEYSKSNNSLTVVADLSGSENTVKSFNINDHVYISNRFTDFNSDKIYREFSQIDRGENKDLLDPARMGRITGIDHNTDKDRLKEYSSPDDYNFTDSQERAFRHVYENTLTVLQGPPGTGKTDFIARAVITLCRFFKKEAKRNLRVLITANSHAAIENVLFMIDKKMGKCEDISLYKASRFDDGSKKPVGKVCIVNDYSLSDDTVYSHMRDDKEDRPIVMGSTVWSCAKMKDAAGSEYFDLIIIDEASQVRVMDAMLALSMGRIGASRYLLVGDGDQLSAIIQGRYGKDSGAGYLYGSIFDFYKEQLSKNDLMLCENFRMNEVLLRYSAEKIYGREYTSFSEEIAKRRLTYDSALSGAEDWLCYILDGFSNEEEDYWPLIFCSISGENPYDENRAEVMMVTKLTEALRQTIACPDDEAFWLGKDDKDGILGIVSPHHKHIEALKDDISGNIHMNRDDLYIGTVDKLQGQQREAVIVSYGVTDLERAVTEGEFIFNRNRLNVALTRAKCKSITIFSDILTKPSPEMLDTDDEDLQHGIEYVCGFHDFMQQNEADTEIENKRFELRCEGSGNVIVEIYKKRIKLK